ncbi:MAG TPA: glycosyltransferase [Pyrinomonadaceae bacterium]|jgi:glycosyltransferase involved in cell wall biosynthesis|nr:glycosyltransferase [Pyrinomonadaceae bacterium]
MIATELQEETAQTLPGAPATVAVVVPSYNHARFIEATLGSIMKQTLQPAQLIVIDDGSSDGSPALIEQALNQCSFPCEFVARDNRGLCATLNEGFERTRGDYFAYLGSDDLWLPDFLEARVRLLELRPDAVLAYGHAYLIDEQSHIVDCTADWARYTDGDAREMLLQTTAPMSPTVLYRREVLERQRWNEAAKLEDYDLYLRLSAAGPFAFDAQVLSAWRRHESNVSRDQRLMLDEQLQAQREAALRFGLTEPEIAVLQRATRFSRAEDFLRVGEKSQALSLMMHNLRGLSSPRTTARMLLRVLLPNSFMRGRARVRQRKAHERYGTINI